MREMKDSGVKWIGEIPKEWHIVKIKYLPDKTINNSYTDGDWIESPDVSDEGIRYLTTGNIGDGKYKDQGKGFITLETFNRLNCKYAYPGDLIISRLNAPYGRSCILPNDYSEYVLAVDNVILRPTENKKYICYISQCDGYQHSVEDVAKGTTMKRISRTNLGNIFLPIPTKEEQECIVEYLDAKCSKIDEIIEKQQAIIEKLKEYKLSVIIEAVTKGLNPNVEMKDSGVEWIGQMPTSWDCTTVGMIATVVRGASPRPAGDPLYFNGKDVPWITVAEVTKGEGKYIDGTETFLTFEGAKQSRIVEEGTLLLSNSGATLGVPKITRIRGCINDGSVAFYNLCINQEFLLYLFKGRTFELRKQMQGYGQPNLNTTIVKKIEVPLPTEPEQKAIVDFLDQKCIAVEKTIKDREKVIDKLQEYKKSLIYEVVTGKKEV